MRLKDDSIGRTGVAVAEEAVRL